MELAISASLQELQLDFSRAVVKQTANSGTPTSSPDLPQDRVEVSSEAATLQAGTLSIDGSLTGANGTDAAFSLDLQVLRASASSSAMNLNVGPNGYDVSYARSSAALSYTSFDFSLTGEVPDEANGNGAGLGSSTVKEELKEIRHTTQPLIKNFLRDACAPPDKPNVNKLFRVIA